MSVTPKEQLLQRIHDHSAVIAIIGLGYVGLPLGVAFAENGFSVVGIDVDAAKVEAINRGESLSAARSQSRQYPCSSPSS